MKLPLLSLASAALLLALLAAATQSPTASALYCTSFPTQASVEEADVVLIGTFLTIEEPDEEGIDATVEVERYLRGEGPASVTVRSTAWTKTEDGQFRISAGAWYPQRELPTFSPASEGTVEVIDGVQTTPSDIGKRYLLVLEDEGDVLIAGWCYSALPLDHPEAEARLAEVEAITGPGAPPERPHVQQQSILGNGSWLWGIGAALVLAGLGSSGLTFLQRRR